MLKIGLTGGIGCGKSTAVDAFRTFDIPIIDADQISKSIVEKGQPALTELVNAFGPDVLMEDGSLNRGYLKEKVFADKQLLEKLESILHPIIRQEIDQQINDKQQGNYPYVIVDVPLLVEKNYQPLFDMIVVVDCLPEQQIERVKQRDNLEEHKISKIIQTQASRETRNSYADEILDNSGDKKSLIKQVKTLHEKFARLSGKQL